ncbi:methyltransferase domain-containing protein [Candidatus Bathyarchaeota archaeon]|nr:MAG: methyltransferase domain-containing protein [Candidatus Bathyarchaeota archaeon]
MKASKSIVQRGGQSLDSGFRAHYNAGVERDRLLRGTSNLEFERTKRILLHYLPSRPATILDVGGGPGRYSFWLSEMGHSVHLVDILPLHTRQAREFQRKSKNRLASINLGDARRLDFDDGSADIVLLFGPLYHLVRKKERLKALAEARRVLKPGGLLFAAAISRFTSAVDGSLRGFIRDPEFMTIIQQDLKNGQHRNPSNKPEYFTTSFFHHPSEFEAEMKQARFRSVKVYGVTGFAWLLPRLDQIWRDPTLKARLMSILDRTELEPSMLGISDHLLAVGKK